MYLVFTPNKVFVQFQLIDYCGDSTDLYVIFTPHPHFSLKKFAKKRKIHKIKKEKPKKQEGQLNSGPLDAYLPNKPVVHEKTPLSSSTQTGWEPFPLSGRFNLIQLAEPQLNLASPLNTEELEAMSLEGQNTELVFGSIGKYTAFKRLLETRSEIQSRYVAGFIHAIYLQDFAILGHFKRLGFANGSGFDLMTYFNVLYFLPFMQARSFEEFGMINSLEIAILMNYAGKPSPYAIRKFWNRTLDQTKAVQLAKTLYMQITQLDPRLGYGVYVDEHLIVYQGRKKMAKGKGGRGTQFLKGFYRYSLTCAQFSIPLYTVDKEGRTRLEPVLFDLLADYKAVSGKEIGLLLFDRGIKSFETLKQLVATGYHFICWSFPYSTVERALQRRSKLKFVRISEMLENLLEVRQKGLLNAPDPPEARALRQFIEACLPVEQLQAKLRGIRKKEAGEQDWNERDFLWLRDTPMAFEEYGLLRTILLERPNGTRLGIFTSIPATQAHAIEILELLKRKQRIENYFKFKAAIQGDYIPSWHFKESTAQKTPLKELIQEPDWNQLAAYRDKCERVAKKLKKLESDYKTLKGLYKTGVISKNHFIQRESYVKQQYRHKEKELEEIKAFLEWGETGQMPPYFTWFTPLLELDSPLEILLNAVNDLFFVNSRRIAIDWANALTFAKKQGTLDLPSKWINRIANLTPSSLSNIFVKGGGKVRRASVPNALPIIELHVELFYKDENLIEYYLNFLNTAKFNWKFDISGSLQFKFCARSDKPCPLVKVV